METEKRKLLVSKLLTTAIVWLPKVLEKVVEIIGDMMYV